MKPKDRLDAKDLEIADLKRKLVAAYAEIDRLHKRLEIEPGPNDDLGNILPADDRDLAAEEAEVAEDWQRRS
jgi:hypothetical protein